MKASIACLSMRCLASARRILACPLMLKFQQGHSCVLSRAANLALCMQAGMTSINDFATTYMCQSLPFGGVKRTAASIALQALRACEACAPQGCLRGQVSIPAPFSLCRSLNKGCLESLMANLSMTCETPSWTYAAAPMLTSLQTSDAVDDCMMASWCAGSLG